MKNNKICDGIYEPKLKFKFGEELFNQKDILNKRKTSITKEIKLLFPSELKHQLLQIVSNLDKKDKLDINLLRINFPNVFWSLIFYFDLNNIDKSFMLPYTNFDSNIVFENKLNENIEYIISKKPESEEEKTNNYDLDLNLNNNLSFKKFYLQNCHEIKKYDNDDLCIQNIYSLGLIDNLLYSYKNLFTYEENIGYNILPIVLFENEIYSPIIKRSSLMIFNESDNNNFVIRDSVLPLQKRNSDGSIDLNLKLPKGEMPIDNHILIKKKNPLEDRIFDFESSDDDDDVENDENEETSAIDVTFKHKKCKTLEFLN